MIRQPSFCYDGAMTRTGWMAVVVTAATVLMGACSDGGSASFSGEVAPTPRRTVVWLDDGVDVATAGLLAASGVDQLVVRRGEINLAGPAPVLQLRPAPTVEGPIPVAIALEVTGLDSGVSGEAAEAVWSALGAEFGDRLPSELILDLPVLGDEAGGFASRLAAESGLAVAPILTVEQLETEAGRRVAEAANQCIVPLFGTRNGDLRGLDEVELRPLADRLEAVRDLGVRIRVAVSLRPQTEPEVMPWGEDLNVLTDGEVADIRRGSNLDRSFEITKPVSWGGRDFGVGETLAVAWVDAAKLHLFFAESQRLVLPEIGGWDLVSLPPEGDTLGLGREELVRYLGGEGPAPEADVNVRRSGRSVTVRLVNRSPFRSAVTGFGNWIQIELASGALVARSRGGFDRVILGSTSSGQWKPSPTGGADAVRFVETYVAPGEEIVTGSVRLPSSRSRIVVRWQVQASDGSIISGVAD